MHASIETLGLSDTSLMRLWGIGVLTVADLSGRTREDLLRELRTVCKKDDALKTIQEVEDLIGITNSHEILPPEPGASGNGWLLTDAHLQLVKKMVFGGNRRTLQRAILDPAIDHNDVLQECFLEANETVRRFDKERGTALTTYLEYRIRGTILDVIRSSSPLPRSVLEALAKIERAQRLLWTERETEPAIEDIAACIDMPVDKVYEVLAIVRIRKPAVSLDELQEMESGEGENLYRFIPTDTTTAFDDMANVEFEAAVHRLRTHPKLSPSERRVLDLYCGFSGPPRTMKETGKVLGVTESRISQLYTSACNKLGTKEIWETLVEHMPGLPPPSVKKP